MNGTLKAMHKLISEIIELLDRVRKGDFVVNLSKGVTEPEKTLAQSVVTPLLPIEPDLSAMDDYADTTDVSERQARRELAKLEALGLIERRGKGPATAYRRTTRLPS